MYVSMCVKIKQTFRIKKGPIISCTKFELNCNAEIYLISFTNDYALIWMLKCNWSPLDQGWIAQNFLFLLF